MIRTVIKPLNARTGSPDTAAAIPGYLEPGTDVNIVATLKGTMIEGNDNWYQAADGHFYWSGGFDLTQSDAVLQLQSLNPVSQRINYNGLFELPNSLSKNQGRAISIAILDSGINNQHVDLQQASINLAGCFNDNPGNETADLTPNGHGTHIAGLIAANAGGTGGVIGIAPSVTMHIYKVLTDSGAASAQFLLNALNDINQNGPMPDIINMSLNVSWKSYNETPGLIAILDEISSKTICVASAGNNETLLAAGDSLFAPAIHNRFISVGAVKQDFITGNPNPVFHPRLDFIVPEFSLYSCSNQENNGYRQLNGSSMSAAIGSSVIALLLSSDKSLKANPSGLKTALRAIAKPWSSADGLHSFTILKTIP